MATRVWSSRRRCPANAGTAVPTTPAVTADDSSRAFVTRRMSSSLRCRAGPRSRRAIPSDAPEASGSFGDTSDDRSIGVEHGDHDASRLEGRPRQAVRLRALRSRLDEYGPAVQPVPHPVDGLAFLEEAWLSFVVAAGPADRPLAGAHPLDELEAVGAGVVEDLVVGHPAIVAPAWDGHRPVASPLPSEQSVRRRTQPTSGTRLD
jgi:hypothetical protein